ncbi:TPA: hypothetical protein R9129_000316 [Campylobacter upsaliensis]|nr:hypothetical protein [Campylobacter upsaliensis]
MFEVIEPFSLSDVLEILKITGFFALVYSFGALVGFFFVNLLFEKFK